MSKAKETVENKTSLNISMLAPKHGSRHKRKRLGFGEGSGLGKTCGKGYKGQSSRSGYGLPAGFEGGQMPIYRRLPKVGFTSRKRVMGVNTFKILNLDDLTVLAEKLNTANISVAALVEGGVINANTKVKVLAGGEKLAKKISVEVHAISESAKKAIEAAGGDVKLV